LNVVRAVLTSNVDAALSFLTASPSAPSSMITSFGPAATALALLCMTGSAISSTGKLVCGGSSQSWALSANRYPIRRRARTSCTTDAPPSAPRTGRSAEQ